MLMIEWNEILRRAQRGWMIERRVLRDQRGFAAIIISIVLVLLLSLITVGFATLMRKEQRSALDRHLSNVAYYASESGINDAVAAVQAGFTVAKNTCAPYTAATILSLPAGKNQTAATKYLMNSSVDNSASSSYSCLTIDPNPSTLEYSSVQVNQPTTAMLTGSDSSGTVPQNIDTLVFSWQDAGSGKTFAPYNNIAAPPGCPPYNASNLFPSVPCWQSNGSGITGVLRVSLTPIPPSNSLDRNTLETSSYTAFMYPLTGGAFTVPTPPSNVLPGGIPSDVYNNHAGIDHTGVKSGDIVNASCSPNSQPRYCQVAVTNLGDKTYLLRLSSLYAPTQVTITPFNCSSGTCTRIYAKGAQTLIDSTGKAQDVLRRVQVRLPARSSFGYPEFSIATGGPVCKGLTTYPDNATTGTAGVTTSSCDPL